MIGDVLVHVACRDDQEARQVGVRRSDQFEFVSVADHIGAGGKRVDGCRPQGWLSGCGGRVARGGHGHAVHTSTPGNDLRK